ncbi:MAG: hypothetical protein PUI29_09175 [Aeromonadales bacterium]|nr:hypothetical protein [Aeromonadales bacterium]MDY2889942.1 hypothetical protein [Succinivibrio sp.]
MASLVSRFLRLFMLLFALAVVPSYEDGSLASVEAREVFEFCGAQGKAMDIARSGALYSLRYGSVERFMESSGLLGNWRLVMLRVSCAFYAYATALPFLMAASWLGFRHLALSKIRAMSGTSDLRLVLSLARKACLWALCFFLLEDSFPSFMEVSFLTLCLAILIPASASAALASARP